MEFLILQKSLRRYAFKIDYSIEATPKSMDMH